jgi:hypothetical protein
MDHGILNDELEGIWKEFLVVSFKELYKNFSRWTEEPSGHLYKGSRSPKLQKGQLLPL